MDSAAAESLDRCTHRLLAEYLEMPGLSLTLNQARRLCGLGEQCCQDAFTLLVTAGFLHQTPMGQYVRTSEGPVTAGTLRMARASLRPPARIPRAG